MGSLTQSSPSISHPSIASIARLKTGTLESATREPTSQVVRPEHRRRIGRGSLRNICVMQSEYVFRSAIVHPQSRLEGFTLPFSFRKRSRVVSPRSELPHYSF